ncbi:MAG: CHASE2 domain-containing protein [Pseudomonadota bacterium]|nr:CHASE2 domain-containing protein [Pseudomonadota bacterium]
MFGSLVKLEQPADFLRSIAIAFVALVAASAVTGTAFFQKIDLQLHDVQARWLAREVDFSDIIFVDVSEESMNSLEPEIGAWPYSRAVYAKVTEFLRDAGARSITFDIVFAERRPQDEELATTLAATPGVTLAVLAKDFTVNSAADTETLLKRISWNAPANAPALAWQQFILPREMFIWAGRPIAAAGVIAVSLDSDGVLRRIPLLHRVGDRVLPGLSAATVFAGEPRPEIRYNQLTREVIIGKHAWPVDKDGSIQLRFPSNYRSMETSHFSDVFHAAMTMQPAKDLAEKINGRRVFVGSTAESINDYQNTLFGRKAGLHLLGEVNQLLEQGEVLAPPVLRWDMLLLALALLVPVASFRERENRNPLHYAVGFVLLPLLIGGLSSTLYLYKQSTALGFPLLAGYLAFVFFLVRRLWRLYNERQRLFYEKLAAEESYKLKSQFISHMTHELRTPLAAIIGFNRLLGESEYGERGQSQYTKVIEKNSDHLMTLINNMLDQGKIEAGQMKISKAPALVREVVDDVIATMSNMAAEKQLGLKALFDETVPNTLEFDSFRLRQVLLNLLSNAIKFTQKGHVHLTISWANSGLCIQVSDSGPGMTADVLDRIFIPFRQGADNTQHAYGGTGLGLAISRNLCELMGGSLTVHSEVGKGSDFKVLIPAPACAESNLPLSQPTLKATDKRLQGCVLLADDNDDIRDLVIRLLKKHGVTVLPVIDGRQAVETALQEMPDVVLMDIEMPVMDGLSATKLLRKSGFTRPIFAMTAYPEGPEVERALKEGFDGYLEKPVNRDKLYGILAAFLKPMPQPAAVIRSTFPGSM